MKCKTVPEKNSLARSTRTVKSDLNTCKITSPSAFSKHFKLKLKTSLEPSKRPNMIKLKKKPKLNETGKESLIEKSTKLDENLKKNFDDSSTRCCCCCSSSYCSNRKHEKCQNEDDAIIRQPINLGTTNVRQIFQCVHNGTAEIKDIILNECNIIYECKSCKSLFRSLSNLLYHKRQYCKNHICEQMILFDETLINLEENDCSVTPCSKSTNSENLATQDNLFVKSQLDEDVKAETEQISEINLDAKLTSKSFSAKRIYLESCLEKIMSDKKKQEKEKVNFKLVKINSNPNAVYQQVNPINLECVQLKKDLDFNSKKLNSGNQIANLKDDKKLITTNSESNLVDNFNYHNESPQETEYSESSDLKKLTNQSDENPLETNENKSNQPAKKLKGEFKELSSSLSSVTCHLCNSKFSSKKTLNVHLQTIHSVTRLVYPCPFCYLTFKQLFNATRHMIQVHRKGKTQVKFLREAVRRRAYPEIKSEDSLEDEEEGVDYDFGEDEIELDFGENKKSKEEDENSDFDLNKKEIEQKKKVLKISNEFKKMAENGNENENDCNFNLKSKDSCSESLVENLETLEISFSDLIEEGKEKKKGVNPIIYSCVYECGKYFVKSELKLNHEKKCTHKLTQKSVCDKVELKKESPLESVATRVETEEGLTGKLDEANEANDNLFISNSVCKDIKKFGDTKLLKCHSCPDLHFSSKPHLMQHLVLHIGCEMVKCKECKYQTLDKNKMDHHLKSTHGIPETSRNSHILYLSTLKNDSSNLNKQQDSNLSSNFQRNQTKPEKSPTSSIILHLRPKLSRDRRKKKIYEIVGD